MLMLFGDKPPDKCIFLWNPHSKNSSCHQDGQQGRQSLEDTEIHRKQRSQGNKGKQRTQDRQELPDPTVRPCLCAQTCFDRSLTKSDPRNLPKTTAKKRNQLQKLSNFLVETPERVLAKDSHYFLLDPIRSCCPFSV